MKVHQLHHLLSETLALGAVVFPFATALAVLIGLPSWIFGGREIGVRASWIAWCATMSSVPIVLRIACGPDTKVLCDRCISLIKNRRYPRCEKAVPAVQKEQRRHPRYRVELPATFFNDRTSGFLVIGNISAGGCKVRSKVPIAAGDFGQLLIDLPGYTGPLKVSQASVRWVRDNECGMEFLRMDRNEQGVLNHLIDHIGVDEGSAQLVH
jgi:hypothetical protein